jgi:hypothetical protein
MEEENMVSKGIRPAEGEEALVASNQKKVLAALMDSADPDAPPTEDEILGLILGEMAFMRKAGAFAPEPAESAGDELNPFGHPQASL